MLSLATARNCADRASLFSREAERYRELAKSFPNDAVRLDAEASRNEGLAELNWFLCGCDVK